ncbi:hypothetical protein BvCmsKKNP002_04014 [Escherichia coli]|nr:hypothetical protein BvCmsKKNP002_04014 [Escherichia coli]
MKIITRGEAMRIHQQHPTSRLFPFCMAVLTISIDLTKNEFQIHGLGRNRKI